MKITINSSLLIVLLILNLSCAKNDEPPTVDDDKYKFTQWSDCEDRATIQYYLTQDGGHSWPEGSSGGVDSDPPSQVINAGELLWDFFQQNQLP